MILPCFFEPAFPSNTNAFPHLFWDMFTNKKKNHNNVATTTSRVVAESCVLANTVDIHHHHHTTTTTTTTTPYNERHGSTFVSLQTEHSRFGTVVSVDTHGQTTQVFFVPTLLDSIPCRPFECVVVQ